MSYTNKDVIHAWAANWAGLAPCTHRRSSNGNCSFNNGVLYSYSTPIARHTKDKDGNAVTLITARKYSVTTSGKHMPGFHELPSGTWGILVDDVMAKDQRENYKRMLEDIREETLRLTRARNKDTSPIESMVEVAYDFRRRFRLRLKEPAVPSTLDLEALAERDRKRQEAKKAATVKAAALRKAQEAKDLKEWLTGGVRRPPAQPIHFRVITRGGNQLVESTMGARVPLADAIRVARLANQCARAGVDYSPRFNKTLQHSAAQDRVGDFQLDYISTDGTVKIGCHVFTLAEIRRAAEAAGVALD